MSKLLYKISAIATIILLSAQSSTFAATTKNVNEDLYKGIALQLIREMKIDKSIEGSIPLYDTKGEVYAMLFDLDSGYIIVDETTKEVSEFNLTKDNQFFNDASKHYVYGGPTQLYEEKNNKLTDLRTNKEQQDKNEIQENIMTFEKNVQVNKTSKVQSITSNAEGDLHGLMIGGRIPNLDYNPNGICGSTAVANLLTFFSWNVDSRFVPSRYQDSINSADEGKEFIKSIVPYVESDGEGALDTSKMAHGSTPEELKNGLSKYLVNRVGYIGPLYMADGTYNPEQPIAQINKGLPFVLGLHETAGNKYKNHWVLGVGYIYREPDTGSPLYYRVVNGWGENDAYVNFGWTDYVVYI